MGRFARFFHAVSGLPVTAVNFFLLFPASLRVKCVQEVYLVFLLRGSLLIGLRVPDRLHIFREQPLLCMALELA